MSAGTTQQQIDGLLHGYSEAVIEAVFKTREQVLKALPDVTEQADVPARMIAYVYGPKYADTICVIIPSKQGVKLGFYKGTELSDPDGLLQGTGKVSRYVQIMPGEAPGRTAVNKLLKGALVLYKERTKTK